MTDAFVNPFMYVRGMNIRDPEEGDRQALDEFYRNIHVPEVLGANPGMVGQNRFYLSGPDPRGAFGPESLSVYEIDSEPAAKGYIARNDGSQGAPPQYSSGPPVWENRRETMWRLIYRQLAESNPPASKPASIYLVGIDAPKGSSPAELDEFNDFYTKVHLVEVMEKWGFIRGTRYECIHEFAHPAPGCPRFLAVYESSDPTPRIELGPDFATPGVELSEGPEVWRGHTTPWRLSYQPVG